MCFTNKKQRGVEKVFDLQFGFMPKARRRPMSREEFVTSEIRAFLNSKKRSEMLIGQRYYAGRHDILLKQRTAIGEEGRVTVLDNLPNNRIEDNCYRRIVQQKVNYLLGRPLLVKSENPIYDEKLKEFLNAEFQGTLRQLAADGLNCGLGYLYVYADGEGKLGFKVFRPYEIIPGWADEAHKKLDYVIRIYKIECADGREPVKKAEFYSKKRVYTYRFERNRLVLEKSVPYFRIGDRDCRFDEIPIIPFKYSEDEQPLITGIKSLQDGLNTMLSAYQDSLQEDSRNTILVIKNYDGEDLGEFRRNLAAYGAVKVRAVDGVEGDVQTLNIKVDGSNFKSIIELLKKTIVENGRGFDVKALREMSSPNQMNIQSMYADIDLDANGMEAEMQFSLARLIRFISLYLYNTAQGNFIDEKAEIIFNRDVLINENEAIDGCVKSIGLISNESLLAQHPYVNDVAVELARLEKEKKAQRSGKKERGNDR